MASSEQLKLVIDVVNKNALKGMGDLKKAAKGVGDELDDTRTAAKRVAAELEKRADEMASDLKSSEKAAEALANALLKLEQGAQRYAVEAPQPATASLFIVNPFAGAGSMMRLFSTHPETQERVRRLMAMAQSMSGRQLASR